MRFCDVFGLKIASGNMEEAVGLVCNSLEKWRGQMITFVNAHTAVTAHDDEKYKEAQERAVIRFADGFPVACYEKMQGYKGAKRIAGPDFMKRIFELSEQRGYRHFFYGSSEETLKKLKKNLEQTYPGIQIVGCIAPPYEKKLKNDYSKDVELINAANPDFVWIGLGAPKQELWMAQNTGKVNGLMLGVGAGFDFHAGTRKRAPKWMQRMGLEWFYRFLEEPKRLGKRYMETNMRFLLLCFHSKRSKNLTCKE